MRQRLDVPGLYADALSALPETIDGQPALPVPASPRYAGRTARRMRRGLKLASRLTARNPEERPCFGMRGSQGRGPCGEAGRPRASMLISMDADLP